MPTTAAAVQSGQSTIARRRESASGISEQASVFLVDGPFARCGLLRDLFEEHGLGVEIYDSDEHFLATDNGLKAGCVLVDAARPTPTDLRLIATLRSEAHRLPAILVADEADTRLVVNAMKLGAFDVVAQPLDPLRLLSAVQEALGAIKSIDRQTRSFAPVAAQRTARSARSTLTPRQDEILVRIVDGQPNKIIAADLGISQRTAENHRAAIMRKMGASSISSLVQLAIGASSQADIDADVAAVGMIEVIPTILKVVSSFTGLRFAAVARVTEDRWIACAVRDEIEFGLGLAASCAFRAPSATKFGITIGRWSSKTSLRTSDFAIIPRRSCTAFKAISR